MSKRNPTNEELDQREANHAINNYTRVPNMLVDGYPELHPQDKWLFVCLMRLCGKEGTRHLSLRYIADRTGFTPSVLSDNKGKPGMIKRLHNAGVIHAEIKRKKKADGTEEKNAQYHITIADTWKLNYDFFHPETCSESEQDTQKPVRNQNATCSESGANVRLQSKITESNKITESKKERSRSRSSTPSQPSSQEKSSSEKNSKKEVEFSPEEQAIYDFGKETIFRVKPPKKTQYVKGQCAEIAKAGIKTLEQFKSLVILTKQESGFKTLHLGNLIKELNGWVFMQQFNDSPPPQASTPKAGTTLPSSSYDDDDFEDDTFYSVREVKNREEVNATR